VKALPLIENTNPEFRDQTKVRARGIIKELVTFFGQLPIYVGDLRLREEAAEIKGFQEAMGTVLPTTSEADGIIADVETGIYQARLVQELSAKPEVPVAVPTAPHVVVEAPAQSQLVGHAVFHGGGIHKK
jgi:hypothetical protein